MSTTPRAADSKRDQGSALILVLGVMGILTIFASVALTAALRTSDTARDAESWNQAFAAAESGVDDYLARLNRDDGYWRTVDCTNTALQKAYASSGPCGWKSTTKTGWLDVPGTTDAQFHYDVDITSTFVDGTIDLVATGRSGGAQGATRSVEVTLRRGGFGEFLYYTVYETQDPADFSDPTTAYDKCAHYYWEPRTSVSKPRDTDYCNDISFISADTLNGPVHSNDTILMSGTPWFQGTLTTSAPTCKPVNGVAPATTKCYRKNTTSTAPRFDKGIAYRSEVELPTSIGDLRQYVDPTQTTTPGCLYTGPTRIVFNAPVGNATPTMTVWSKWSKKALNPGCGNYTASWPQTVAVPQNRLIMVQNVPSTQSTPVSGPCTAGSIGDGLPLSGDYNETRAEANCRYGSVFVQGTLKGRVTISADNNVVLTGNLTYQGGENGTDALGLIAQNSVQVYHPVTTVCTRTSNNRCVAYGPGSNMNRPSGSTFSNPIIHASILTLQHSFEVQEYDVGNPLGSLTVFGSLAQRFRGIVGQGSTSVSSGYAKNYKYDSRLRYAPPPYFLDPIHASWGQKTFGEVAPRYGG